MIFNSFITKNNTIFKNSQVNTGKNPVVELYYGGDREFSRYIFNYDIKKFVKLFIDGKYNISELYNFKHTLYMINTQFFAYRNDFPDGYYLNYKRANSFELVLYSLEESFDEGRGYDQNRMGLTTGKVYIKNEPSNYYNRKTMVEWTEPGGLDLQGVNDMWFSDDEFGISVEHGYSELSLTNKIEHRIISAQHFDDGIENVEMDISNYINSTVEYFLINYSKLTSIDTAIGDSTVIVKPIPPGSNPVLIGGIVKLPGFGRDDFNDIDEILDKYLDEINFMLCFSPKYENSRSVERNYVGFFSKHSNSAYSPFVQSKYTYPLNDNRSKFLLGENNEVYASDKNSDLFDRVSEIIITDTNDIDNNNYSYYISATELFLNSGYVGFNLSIPNEDIGECVDILYDLWFDSDGNVIYEGVIEINKNRSNLPLPLSKQIGFVNRGLNNNEKLNIGEIRRVYIDPKVKYTTNQIYDGVQMIYRVYALEGTTEIPFIDVDDVYHYNGDFYFDLDTTSFLPNKYYIDLVCRFNNGEVTIIKKFLEYEIISTSIYSPLNNKHKNKLVIKNGLNGARPNNGGGGEGGVIVSPITPKP